MTPQQMDNHEPKDQAPLVTVVIVNYNRRDDLRDALESVRKQDHEPVEVIVVDNASSDGSEQMLKAEFPEVRCIRLEKNIGMDGYTLACQAAQGQILFQMDNDSLMPDASVLSKVVAAFQQATADVAVMATHVAEHRKGVDDVGQQRLKDQRQGMLPTGGFHSGGVAFRKALMDTVGYYNEDVFLYGAELFVQAKVWAAGYKLLYLPEVLMLHCGSGTARSPMGVYYETRNRYWFMRHYGSAWQQARHLPFMVLHDFVYAIHKKSLSRWRQALLEGFGPLPASLQHKVRSPHPMFVQGVDRVGRSFSIGRTVARTWQRFLTAKSV